MIPIRMSPISPFQMASLIDLIIRGVLSDRMAKEVFNEMWEEGIRCLKLH